MANFDLNLDDIAKIEGKCSLSVVVKDDRVQECKFSISELKRFYTQALRNKDVLAVPQLTCRICGTCSNAHLLCALKAIEKGLGMQVTNQTEVLRQLVNYGLMIRDHALHLYVFVLPDLLGIDNILELDENDSIQNQMLTDCFDIKAAGNKLSIEVGGRSIHAPNLTVGGFTKLPSPEKLAEVKTQLLNVRPAALRAIKIFYESDKSFVRTHKFASQLDERLTFLKGNIKTSDNELIKEEDYGNYLTHIDTKYSHASAYKFKDSVYLVGAIARLNLGREFLHPNTKRDVEEALKVFPSNNTFHNNLAQAIEILHSIDRSLDILETIQIVDEKPIPVVRKAGRGIAAIEAPRGTLFYDIVINDKGAVDDIKIVVPTGQNQISIEETIRIYIESNINKDKNELISEIEQIVRAYDPCMSCASHFLKVKWKKL